MEIEHSVDTRVESSTEDSTIGGVRLLEEIPGARVFVEFPLEEIDRHLHDADAVIGACEEDIRVGLEKMKPCEYACCTHVHKGSYEYKIYETPSWSSRRRVKSETRMTVWFVFKRPVCSHEDIDFLRNTTLAIGPVLIPEANCHPQEMEREGFTCRERKYDMYQVNYNPGALALIPWREEMKEYEKRIAGRLPTELLNQLYCAVQPGNWPVGHVGYRVVKGKDLTSHNGGWGGGSKTSDVDFGVTEVLDCVALTQKISPADRGWWRETSIPNHYSVSFESLIETALTYVHGMEAQIVVDQEKHLESSRSHYEQYAVPGYKSQKKRVHSFEEWEAEMNKSDPSRGNRGNIRNRVKLCRWLRAEARALKIKMPAKPVKPVKPGARVRRKKKAKAA